MEKKICKLEGCQKEINPKRKFCSLFCYGKWASKNLSGKNHSCYGIKRSEEQNELHRKIMIKHWEKTPRNQRQQPIEVKEKIKRGVIKYWKNPKNREKQKIAQLKRYREDPEAGENIRKKVIERFKKPGEREKQSKRSKKQWLFKLSPEQLAAKMHITVEELNKMEEGNLIEDLTLF